MIVRFSILFAVKWYMTVYKKNLPMRCVKLEINVKMLYGASVSEGGCFATALLISAVVLHVEEL